MTVTTTIFWWIWVIAICMLMLLIYFDFKSRPSAFRPVRIVAMVVGVASLLGIYLSPALREKAPEVKLVINTSGNTTTILDSLKQADYLIAQDVSEYQEIEASSEVAQLLVVGDGFESWELDEIKHPYNYLPSTSEPEGPFELKAEEGVVNSPIKVDIRLSVADSIQVHLSGSGIETVGGAIAAAEDRVSFSVTPTIPGYLKYQLDGVRNGDTIFSEVVPVNVLARSKTSILILSSTPSFEYRFLKNYLTEEGFGIAERIQLSKDVFRDSFTNLKRRSLRNLNAALLEDFQLVVLDASSYVTLSRAEKSRLKEKLRKGELGLIWGTNEVANDLVKTRKSTEEKVEFEGNSNVVVLSATTERLTKRNSSVSFQDKEIGELLEIGFGKIVFPRVISSYSLILKGEEELYSKLWQRLLQLAIGYDWNVDRLVTPRFPRVGEPMNLEVAGTGAAKSLEIDSVRLAVEERWYQLDSWEATYWPKKKGWNSLDGMSTKFYVFDTTDWPNQKRLAKQARTELYGRTILKQSDEIKQVDQPISKWIFFVAFVMSFGFLWLEQRIR